MVAASGNLLKNEKCGYMFVVTKTIFLTPNVLSMLAVLLVRLPAQILSFATEEGPRC
jgi:hypothetical protein